MPVINFTEIPAANSSDGNQDTFELFARDFLAALGFVIEEDPSRGADGGKDLIVAEPLTGLVQSTNRRWVVSCKHFAPSGRSVGENDEIDIIGRVRKFKCEGFMAFYSTIPSSGLMQTFNSHKDDTFIEVWDKEKIEEKLVSDSRLQTVFERYFPQSYRAWRNHVPRQVFGAYEPLRCAVCGKDLLLDKEGNIALAIEINNNITTILDVYWACIPECDYTMEQRIWSELEAVTAWESIKNLSIPLIYMRWVGTHLTRIRSGQEVFTDKAFERFRFLLLCLSQIVVKETTPAEWATVRLLTEIPEVMGGLGT